MPRTARPASPIRTSRTLLNAESLEARLTPSWGAVPPTTIPGITGAASVALDSNWDATATGTISNGEVDWYKITVPAGAATINAATPTSDLDPVLGVYTAAGTRVAYNNNISSANLDSRVSVQLAAGTYYVGVTNYLARPGGAYTLSIDAVPNTPPTISDVTDHTVLFGQPTGAIPFTVGDTLTAARSLVVRATSSDTSLIPTSAVRFGGSGENRTVNVTPAAGKSGTATITLTVTDGGGLTATDTFSVTVLPNTAPSISDVSNQTVLFGHPTAALPFTIGDAEKAAPSLTVKATSSDPTLIPTSGVRFGGSGGNRTVTVTPAAGKSGTATITLTVSDGYMTATDSFTVVVMPNTAPTISEVADRTVAVGQSTGAIPFTIGDAEKAVSSLTVRATSSDATLIPVSRVRFGGSGENRTLTVTPAAGKSGTATITLTVSDGYMTATDTFTVTVGSPPPPPPPPGPGGFGITLRMTGLTASQQAIFQQAANRWAQVITGDLPDATYGGVAVDDVLIDASAAPIDGVNGILGQAGPDTLRPGSYLPIHGSMQFDTADLAALEANGGLFYVVLHEMGHVLGIGTIWQQKGLLSGAGTSNPVFTGANAVAAYDAVFHTNVTGVPVENSGGAGTRDAHWRESVFNNELMTGYLNSGTNPLSRVTVASLADLGYQVDPNAADAFTP